MEKGKAAVNFGWGTWEHNRNMGVIGEQGNNVYRESDEDSITYVYIKCTLVTMCQY